MSKRTGSRLDAAWWTAWVVGATTLGLLGGPSGIAATATYDLSADFSLAANPTPKGWQYSQQLEQLGGGGGKVGPVVQNWNEPDFGSGQPGWEGITPPGPHAGWAKRVNNGSDTPDFDDPPGTVITHGNTSVLWKAPASDPAGYIEIRGGVWNIRHSGRGGPWRILKNDVEVLTQGFNDDNSGTSAAPNLFATGNAGADALLGIPYKGGDTIRVEILENDFVGVSLTIITSDVPPDPYITKQPVSTGVVALGSTVNFTVEATGTPTLAYQWKKNGNDLQGKTQPTLTLNNVSVNDLGLYTVVVSNSKGSRTSRPASLVADQVLPAVAHEHDLANDFSIAANPTARGWQYSEALDNQLKGGGPVGPVSNDWNSKDFGAGQPGWTGKAAGVWAGWAKRVDNGADLGTFDAPPGAVITHGPNSVLWKVPNNETDKFATISGGLWIVPAGKRGQAWRLWKNDITLLTEGKGIDNVATSDQPMSLENGSGGAEVLSGIPIKPGDTFRLEILPLSGPGGQVTGPYNDYVGVQFKINTSATGPAIAIATHPVSQTVQSGDNVTLSVEAVGAGTIKYQWQKAEFPVPPDAPTFSDLAGQTTQQLSLANIQPEQAGMYRVVVSNTGGSATSVAADVNVNVAAGSSGGGVRHDLATDFSLDTNPTASGWQYSVALAAGGGVVGPKDNNWNTPDFGANQPGWLGPAGTTYAGWAKRVDNGNPTATYDDPVGSVITHGMTSVMWKAPPGDKGGLADITGGLWHIRHLNRPGTWKLWKNDTELLSDGVIDDAVGTSVSPRGLGTGSGGRKVLQNIPYQAGDSFRLEILNGDFVAVSFAITTRMARIHDLAADFSLDANPSASGWQYSVALGAGGGVVGPKDNNWNTPDFGANQPGWLGPAGSTYAGWAKRVDNGNPTATYDDPVGSVLTHGNTSVLWKAAPDDKGGLADISGGLWHIRHLNRPGTWKLWKNDSVLITEGVIDDAVGTSVSPRSLATGSSGPKALQNIRYQAGDSFRLEVLNGDFNGVAFTIITREAALHDLERDFSLDSNPTADGWQYSVSLAAGGGVVGPKDNNWNTPDFGANQPGWLGPAGSTYAGWAQRVDNGNPTATYDDPIGSVLTHGNTSVMWKAPPTDKGGTADISGGLWHIRHLNRPGGWKLWKNDSTLITEGTIDDAVGTSGSPKSLATGTSGAAALQGIPYAPGDSFRLEVLNGDFNGVAFTIITRPPDSVAPRLDLARAGGGQGALSLTWTGAAQLESSSSLTGGWKVVTGATSPYPVNPTEGHMFFRLR